MGEKGAPFCRRATESSTGHPKDTTIGQRAAFNIVDSPFGREHNDGASVGAAASDSAFMNSITTTHRQNFLVPGGAHRSLPLVELL
jgi:hypothetical protein